MSSSSPLSLSTMTNDFMTEWNRLTGEFEKLQTENSFWITSSLAYKKVFFAIAVTAFYCTCVYLISFWMYSKFVSTKETPTIIKTKTAYQMTNMCFHFAIGSLGLYHQYWILPTLPIYNDSTASSIEKMPFLFDEFYLMPAMQLGYQVWSMPIGIFVVNENRQMIYHHIGVVCAALLGAFSNFGFRYWLPFFFGVFEISSIPLAIMNTFNDHPIARKNYPICNHISRISFVMSFLYIRVYMWLPVGPLYMRNDFFLFLSTEFGTTKIFVLIQWMFGVYLGYLQLYWAVLVLGLTLKTVKHVILGKLGLLGNEQQHVKKKEA